MPSAGWCGMLCANPPILLLAPLPIGDTGMPLQRPPSRWSARRTLARFRPLALLLTALTFCVWTPQRAEAQGVTTSALNGFITGDNGKPLEDAQVLAVHLPTGTEYRATARAGGAYSLLNMRVGGPYRVTASMIGFQPKTAENVELLLAPALNAPAT